MRALINIIAQSGFFLPGFTRRNAVRSDSGVTARSPGGPQSHNIILNALFAAINIGTNRLAVCITAKSFLSPSYLSVFFLVVFFFFDCMKCYGMTLYYVWP